MQSSKLSALLLICMIFISTATPILGCGYCGKPPAHHKHPKPIAKGGKPSKGGGKGGPITLPPITVPPIVKQPPVTVPPVTLPPIVKPPIDLPPVTLPPITKPPGSGGSSGSSATCPINTLKLGACVNLLGGLVHVGLGNPVVSECCPVLQGLVELEAAVCLCTALKVKLLNLNIFVPLALQLLIACGKTPPPGFTCSL